MFAKYEPSLVWIVDSWWNRWMADAGRTDEQLDYIFGDMTGLDAVFTQAVQDHCSG